MSVFDVRRVYAQCELFKNCSAEFVRSLLADGGPEATQGEIYDPNVVIVEQGTVGHAMYLIHRGEAEVLLNGTMVAKLGAGAHFGEMQLLGLTPMRTATVRSLTICHIFEVRSEIFVRLLLRFRQERRLFEREAMRRYRELAEVRRQQKRRQRQTEQLYGGVVPSAGCVSHTDSHGNRRTEVRVSITDEMTASLEAAAQGDVSAFRKLRSQQTVTRVEDRAMGGMSQPGTASTTTVGNVSTAASYKSLATAGEFSALDESPHESAKGSKAGEADSPPHSPDRSPQNTTTSRSMQGYGLSFRVANPNKSLNQTDPGKDSRFTQWDLEADGDEESRKQNVEEETFVQRVARSLRTDTKRGFMAASSSWVPPANSHAFRDFNLVEEEEFELDAAQLLETRLLPPIALLSPAQKQGLLRQLRKQAHSKLRRGVNKLNVKRVLNSLKTSAALASTV